MSQGQLAQAPQGEGKLRTFIADPKVQHGIDQALGGYMNVGTFLSQMLIACSNPKIEECTVASQFKSIHICATLGLLPTYQQVALIPRKRKVGEQWITECTAMPQWQGLKALMERHPDVLEVRPVLVLVNDVIEYAGDGDDMVPTKHHFDPLAHVANSIDDVRGGYAKITYRDGRAPRYHFVTADYIRRCMNCSESLKNREKAIAGKKDYVPACPWTDGWFEQQAIKTVLRSAYARRVVPIDPMIAGRVESFLKQEDSLLGNDPRILEGRSEPVAIPHQSRSAAIAGQLTQRRTQPVQSTQPVETQHDPTSEPQQEPVAGELTDAEPEESTEQGTEQSQSVMGEFLDMLAKTKTRREVELLGDHYLNSEEITPNLSSEERDEIRTAITGRLKDFPAPNGIIGKPKKDQQKPLV